jgi:hypothetical protein
MAPATGARYCACGGHGVSGCLGWAGEVAVRVDADGDDLAGLCGPVGAAAVRSPRSVGPRACTVFWLPAGRSEYVTVSFTAKAR